MSAYIPLEIVEKHCLRAYINQPASEVLSARLGGGNEKARTDLAHHLARRLAPRLKLRSEPIGYNNSYRSTAEIFVFTREELAAVLERHYIVMESLPPIP